MPAIYQDNVKQFRSPPANFEHLGEAADSPYVSEILLQLVVGFLFIAAIALLTGYSLAAVMIAIEPGFTHVFGLV